jgi:hypothetical protein
MNGSQSRSGDETAANEGPWPPPVVPTPVRGPTVSDGGDAGGEPHRHPDGEREAAQPEASQSTTDSEGADGLAAPPAKPTPDRSRSRSRAVVLSAIGITLVAALVATGLAVLFARDRGPSHPSTWDARLSEFVSFVERKKGARFEHPVRLVLLDDADFKDRLRVEDGLSDEERKEIEREEAVLRALGLQGGSGSLLDQANTLNTQATAAFYDSDRKEIVVPETNTHHLAMTATLVHELTDALQDQMGQIVDVEDSEAATARRALIEGEAEQIETAWIETLSDVERQTLEQQQAEMSDDAAGHLKDINPAMVAIFTAPYTMGEAMVAALDAEDHLADAFDDPPNSMADVLEPARWLDPVEAIHIEAPSLRTGEESVGEEDTLGAHLLYLMLASVLDPRDALDVVGGWGGDRLRFYTASDGADCVRVAVTGVDSAATTGLGEALETWAESRPRGAASSTIDGGRVVFDACDRGNAPAALTAELAGVPEIRASLVQVIVDAGAGLKTAACLATDVIERSPFELLTSDTLTDAQQKQLRQAIVDAGGSCLKPEG